MRSSKSRSRNKSRNPRSLGNVVNRVFDSSGPEGKVRGTPQQIIEKYLALARDAQLSGDRVAEQSFFQHAEHYTRMLGEAQREQAERQGQFGGNYAGQGDDRDDRPAQNGNGGNGNGNGNGHAGYGNPQPQGGQPSGERRDDRQDRRDDRQDRQNPRNEDRDRRDDRQDRNQQRARDDRGERGDDRRDRGDAPARPAAAPASLTDDSAPDFLRRAPEDRGIPEAIDPQDGPVETPEDRGADPAPQDEPAAAAGTAAAAQPAEAPARAPRRAPRKAATGDTGAPAAPRAPRTRKRAEPEGADTPAPAAD
ncbi:DUF4167 domain-containing protein [Paracoccus luteus]|uniref:DUF4167 domain-containing protein n=1 Tax=Paracoccus luteus TaxID=2508543 RepID=UPI00106F3D1C|nr:DUF4167 domain-containing protein [Paracoccus luteus]